MFQIEKESRINQVIPDNSKTGLVCPIKVRKKGKIEAIKVNLDVAHGFIGDLTIQLSSPSGKKIMLHDRAGGNTKNLNKSYSKDILESLHGTDCEGNWTLTLRDHAPRDNGSLQSWGIEMTCATSGKPNEAEAVMSKMSRPNVSHDSIQECRFSGRVTELSVLVDIAYPNANDLQVQLLAPSGKAVTLHDYMGDKNNLKKTYSGQAVAALLGEKTKGQWKLRMNRKKSEEEGKLRHWKVSLKFAEVDDLKKIEGIGPKIESLLNGAGIFSWSRLSVTSPDHIKTVLTAAGDRFKMHDPTSWPLQAGMAALGNWDELNKWQDSHDGGRLN